MRTDFLLKERIPLNRHLYREAERKYAFRCTDLPQEQPQHEQEQPQHGKKDKNKKKHHEGAITHAVGKVREKISSAIHNVIDVAEQHVGHHHGGHDDSGLAKRLEHLELENKQLKETLSKLEQRVAKIESSKGGAAAAPPAAPKHQPAKPAAKPAPPAKKEEVDDDDDFELFGDELVQETEEQKKVKEQRLKMYAEKKQSKPAIVAKSSVLLDVKPWDDETDMKALESAVRSIKMDGLVWGTSKLLPVAFKIKKLQIQCVIEDDKVSTEELEEKICAFEDYIQSVDIAAFNKI